MRNYSSLTKLVVCGALCCTFGLSQIPSYGQGRSLTKQQLDAVVTPSLSQCAPQSVRLKTGQLTSGRIDTSAIIPTNNAREFPKERIARTLHGMWRGAVSGDYNRDLQVDYFWIIDTQNNEGLIIAQRTGNQSMPTREVPNAPKLTYLICANEGYVPSSEQGSQIHQFTKVSNSIAEAPRVLSKATGLEFKPGRTSLSDMWQQIVASGYFQSLPAVAFAGALFKPIRLELVPSPIGPAQVSLSWDGEYYGGGTTLLKFSPGVPMRGVEYAQYVGTTASAGDFLVASPGNGKIYKVEATNRPVAQVRGDRIYRPSPYLKKSGIALPAVQTLEEWYAMSDYDVYFDSVTIGPLQE